VVPGNGWNNDQQYGWRAPQPVYGWNDQPSYPGYYGAGYSYGWNRVPTPAYDNGYRTYNGSPYNGDGETGQYLMQSGTTDNPVAQVGGIDANPPNDADDLQPVPRVYHHHHATHRLQTGRAAYERPAATVQP
jgi:hypothetical protein